MQMRIQAFSNEIIGSWERLERKDFSIVCLLHSWQMESRIAKRMSQADLAEPRFGTNYVTSAR